MALVSEKIVAAFCQWIFNWYFIKRASSLCHWFPDV